jgi:hypothetical protein
LRDHVYKIKNMIANTGPGNAEVAIDRLVAALPSVVAVPLPKEPPPPPAPYPKRAAHLAPTRAAVAFELKHFAAISLALEELVATTDEGVFKALRRRRAAARAAAAEAAAAAAPKSAGKRPRQPTRLQQALVGTAFEEGGVDWIALAVEWGTDLEKIVVRYYGADMAAGEDLTEEEMNLGRNEGLDLAHLECSIATEVEPWIKEARSA